MAECFLGLYGRDSGSADCLVAGVAAEDVPEAAIRAGDLLGEPDGVDYSPAPASLSDVWAHLAQLGRDHYGRVAPDGSWVPEPAVGGSFTFVKGALAFVRVLAPPLRRRDVKRWECRDLNGDRELVDLPVRGPLLLDGLPPGAR